MLNLNQGGYRGIREVTMDTTQSQTKANPEQLTRLVQASPQGTTMLGRRVGTTPQEEATTFSWPIGTTRAAKDRVASNRRKEECPPEVYIG